MPHPSDSLPDRFRALFRIRVGLLLFALAANVALLAEAIDLVPGVVLFASALVLYSGVTAAFWRCPSCGKYPGNAVMPDLCERCGATIFGLDAHLQPAPLQPHEVRRTIRPILAARAMLGLLVFAFFAVAGGLHLLRPAVFWSASILVLLGSAWFEWRWWRCPHCGGYLKRSLWPGRVCTKCGGELL